MSIDILRRLKRLLSKSDLYVYRIHPARVSLAMRLRKMRAEQCDFKIIKNMRALAEERGWDYTTVAPPVLQYGNQSHCLCEDVVEIAKHAPSMIAKNALRAMETEWLYFIHFGRLLGVTRYMIGESFRCEIPDVFINSPAGDVISQQFEGLPQSYRGADWKTVVMDKVPGPEKTLHGKYVSLLGDGGTNYSHWLVDILLRVLMLERIDDDIKFLVDGPVSGFRKESLEFMGIPASQVVEAPPGWHRLERLVLCQNCTLIHGSESRALE